jgi:nucleoside phosphorylase
MVSTEKKPLLIFAHKGEARFFFQQISYRKISGKEISFYEGKDHLILITGEGKEKVRSALSHFFSGYEPEVNTVYNFGIAGAVNRELKIGEIYPVKKIRYRTDKGETLVTSERRGLTCLTVDEEIVLNGESKAVGLDTDILDMEAYHIAYIVERKKIPFFCYKLISDFAGESIGGEIKDKKPLWSNLLYMYYSETIRKF